MALTSYILVASHKLILQGIDRPKIETKKVDYQKKNSTYAGEFLKDSTDSSGFFRFSAVACPHLFRCTRIAAMVEAETDTTITATK